MKKSILTAAILAAGLCGFAFDYGGSLYNFSRAADQTADDGLKLDQKDGASIWAKLPLGTNGTYLYAQGRYQLERDFGNEKTINAVDVDSLKAVYVEEELVLTAGRFGYADLSGLVYNQAGDGASLSYSIPAFNATVYGFYTGLLNSQFVSIIDDDFEADSDKVYDLCPSYIVSGVKASLPSFLGEHTLSAECFFSAKLDGTSIIRSYSEGRLEGPVFFDGLFYDVTGVAGYFKYDDNDYEITNLSKANVYWYPGVLDSRVVLRSVYTTGKSSNNNGFIGFSSMSAVNSLEDPEYNSIFKTGAGASFKPVSSVYMGAGCDAVFNTEDNKFKYEGFQYDAAIDWQILSDIYAGCSLTQYFDYDDSDNNKTALTLKAILTF